MPDHFIKTCVYSDFPFMQDLQLGLSSEEWINCSGRLAQGQDLPGCRLESALAAAGHGEQELIQAHLEQACRMLCMMWYAGQMVIDAEREFYAATVQEAPEIHGGEAVRVKYYLESFVMFARSALDTASGAFGRLLPDPFPRDKFECFNDLVKKCLNPNFRVVLSPYLEAQRNDVKSWGSIVLSKEKSWSFRDKLAHQMEFPLDYQELRPWITEKKQPVVWVNGDVWLELDVFIGSLCAGVFYAFYRFEDLCLTHLASASGRQTPGSISRRLPLRSQFSR